MELTSASGVADFDRSAATGGLLVADFYTPACVLCKKLEPMLATVAGELAEDLTVVKVNAEALPELAQRYAVRGVPTLVLLKDGKEAARQTGFMTASALRAWIGSNLSA